MFKFSFTFLMLGSTVLSTIANAADVRKTPAPVKTPLVAPVIIPVKAPVVTPVKASVATPVKYPPVTPVDSYQHKLDLHFGGDKNGGGA
jgi:hypothetical protein